MSTTKMQNTSESIVGDRVRLGWRARSRPHSSGGKSTR
jgi:hypothetical protein